MNLNFSSGKKFKDSLSYYEGFNILKKTESKKRILYDVLFISVFLIIELGVFYIISH